MRLSPYPKFQAFDDDGNPLSGGKLYAYKAGTTTAKDTYSNSTGTPNANPVILNSRGEATVYLSGSYKMVLKDDDDVTIWTQDNVSGADFNNIAYADDDLAAAITAAGSSCTTILIDKPTTLSDNLTIPSNVLLWFVKCGIITVPTTKTLTINGPIEAGLYQIFDCVGTGKVVFGVGSVREVCPEWWAVNTSPGTTDMTVALQAAHDCSAAASYVPVALVNRYKFTTLTWSPHVTAIAKGKVYLETANASGRTIQISDAYGRPATYGLNAPRNVVFDGQIYLINTNAANTATAWTFGGASNSYYCSIVTALRGVETRGFNGGVYEFRYNAFLIGFDNCFEYDNDGSVIVIATGTNTGEGIRFLNCTFGTGDGYLIDINNAAAMSFDFIGCSADYKKGLNKTSNTAALLKVNWLGGHWEWNQVTLPYLENDSTSEWNVDGAMVLASATSGWPTYVVSVTTGAGTTRFTNIKYALPAGLNTLHRYVSSTSVGVLDYTPNYYGGNAPTGLVVYHADAVIGYTGITYRELASPSYVPTWSGTIGNGTLAGKYVRSGKSVVLSIKLIWGSGTSHGAATQTFALPFVPTTYPGIGSWFGVCAGTVVSGTAMVAPSGATVSLYQDAATSILVTNAVPGTWTTADYIYISMTYIID